MIVTPGMQKYEVVLQDKYFLRECIQKLSLEDRLDEISYSAKVTLAVPGDQFTGLPIITPGMEIRVSGTKFGETDYSYIIQPGVVWDVNISNRSRRNWNLTIYDRAIYLSKSKDEYLWKEGEKASDRIEQLCGDWGITVKDIPDTGQGLAAATVRAKPLWGVMQDALKETAEKNGRLFTVRMQPDGLEIFEIGTNKDVWVFEFGANLESVVQKQSLSGAVTKVKILGKASDGERSPVVSELNGETDKLGTIQEIISDQKAIDDGTAQAKAKGMLTGIQETVTVEAVDINTIRKGDKVIVEGWEDGLYVMSVRHELGTPGKMHMELATKEYIRRKYYHER
jgi:hypothetical protein